MASIDKAAIVFSIAIALVGVGIAVAGSAADNAPSDTRRSAPAMVQDTPEQQVDPFADIAEKVKSGNGMMEKESIEPKDRVTTDTMDETMMDETMMDETMMDETMMDETMMEEPAGPATHVVDTPAGTSSRGCEQNNMCYIPTDITINAGDTVEWANSDTAAHTVTGGNPDDGPSGVFDSSLVMAGTSFEFTFNEVGSYDYFCIVHPWMVGSVTVN